jgi:hypothetical protein
MLVKEYQAKDHHQNHHQHTPSSVAPEYHTGSRPKYHIRNQRALRTMVHIAEYPVYAGNPVCMAEKCSDHMEPIDYPVYMGSPARMAEKCSVQHRHLKPAYQ